jgi:hypothetical protein
MAGDGLRIDPGFAPCDSDVNKAVADKKNRRYDNGRAKQFGRRDHKKKTLISSLRMSPYSLGRLNGISGDHWRYPISIVLPYMRVIRLHRS